MRELGTIVTNRRLHLREHVDWSGTGLEIGPYDQPTVLKEEADIRYLDRESRQGLAAAAKDAEQAAGIPEIDYVVPDDRYQDHIGEAFDYVIANHVMEHVSNIIDWLRTMADLLKDDGVLFMALPDKKFTFDKYRPDTPFSHVLADHLNGVSAISVEHVLESEMYYDMAFIGAPMDIGERLDLARLEAAAKREPHLGYHQHVFQSGTFLARVLEPILFLGLAPFRLIGFYPSESNYGEFHVVLRKGEPASDLDVGAFFRSEAQVELDVSNELRQALADAKAQSDTLQVRSNALEERLAAAQEELVQVYASHSWRVTAPLRWVRRLLGAA